MELLTATEATFAARRRLNACLRAGFQALAGARYRLSQSQGVLQALSPLHIEARPGYIDTRVVVWRSSHGPSPCAGEPSSKSESSLALPATRYWLVPSRHVLAVRRQNWPGAYVPDLGKAVETACQEGRDWWPALHGLVQQDEDCPFLPSERTVLGPVAPSDASTPDTSADQPTGITPPARGHPTLNPVYWFSLIPPRELWEAQKSFVLALRSLLELAAACHAVRRALRALPHPERSAPSRRSSPIPSATLSPTSSPPDKEEGPGPRGTPQDRSVSSDPT